MKYITILVLFALLSDVKAQVRTIHTGANITISDNAKMTIKGDLKDSSEVGNESIENLGQINLSGDLINQGVNNIFGSNESLITKGIVRFYGTTNRLIDGISRIHLNNLHVDLPGNNLIIDKSILLNDSLYFIDGNLFLRGDRLVMNYLDASSTSVPSGIVGETNLKRIYGPNHPIVVQNVTWNNAATYSFAQLKGIGIDFTSTEYLGANSPNIYRYNLSQECGPMAGSVDRTYRFDNISSAGNITNITARYHDDLERLNYVDGDSMHIYVSTTIPSLWRDVRGQNSTDPGYTLGTVANSTYLKPLSNNTIYTISKDSCDYLPDVTVHQVLNQSDTIFDVSEALFCDASNASARLIADGSPGEYNWITPDGLTIPGGLNEEYFADNLGEYTLFVTDIRGCNNKKVFEMVAAVAAESEFNAPDLSLPLQSCDQEVIRFEPTTPISSSSYFWSFGDGDTITTATNTSTNAETNHLYATTGNYTISLEVTTDDGCVSAQSIDVTVNSIPTAAFSVGTACELSPMDFINQTINDDPNNPILLNWDFGNSAVSTTSQFPSGGNANNTYMSAGFYTATLIATSMGCISAPFASTVTVYPKPVPGFQITSACQGIAVNFTNITDSIGFMNSTDSINFAPLTYLWNFNTVLGGPTSTFENPSYLYASADTYQVSLEVTNVHGCSYTLDSNVIVDEIPVSIFQSTDTCENIAATFIDFSTLAGTGSITSYNWDFGDGNSSPFANTSNTYAANGIYPVSLTVTTSQGCSSTSTELITIYDGPIAAFVVAPECAGTPVDIFNSTVNGIEYNWMLEDVPGSFNTVNVTQTYTAADTYTITLEATSMNGCKNTFIDSVLINPLPNDNFDDTTTTCGSSNVLDAQSNSSNIGANFAWNTGSTSNAITVFSPSNYSVIITTPAGCTITDETYALLNVPVSPNLGPDSTFCDSAVLNAGYYGQGTSYNWFIDGVSTLQTNQYWTAFVAGEYKVEIVDGNNCPGRDSIIIIIAPSTPVNLGDALQETCLGTTLVLESDISGATYLWSDGSNLQTLDVNAQGLYSIEVTVGSCTSSDDVFVSFLDIPNFNLNTISEACDSLVLNAYAPGSVTYEWSTTNNNVLPTDTVYAGGLYWVEVELAATGCKIRDSIDVTIYDSPTVDLPNDTSICSYQVITIDQGNPSSGFTFLWNTGSPNASITVASTGNYSVNVIDQATSCSSSGSVNVVSLPLFSFDLGNNLPYCEGSVIDVSPNLNLTDAQYNWYNYAGNVGVNEVFNVPDTGVYYLEITNKYGCLALDSVEILPSNLSLYAIFLADSEVEPGTNVQFVNLSYPKPFTSSWDFGDGSPLVSDSMPAHPFFIAAGEDSSIYDVTLSLNNGVCNSIITKSIKVKIGAKVLEEPNLYQDLYTSILEALVYPNPNNGDFTLRIELDTEAPIQVDVFNLMGQLIHKDSFVSKKIDKPYALNKILPGMYLIRIRAGKDQQIVKFIKLGR